MRHPSRLASLLLIALTGGACGHDEARRPAPAPPGAATPPPAPSAPPVPTAPPESPDPPMRRRSELPKTGAGSIQGDCDVNPCPAGQECVLIEVHCIRAPCPPQPECVLP